MSNVLGPVLKRHKVPKYYDQHCLKIFLLLPVFPIMIQDFGKRVLIWLKIVLSKNYQ